jgi:hypothetical protein
MSVERIQLLHEDYIRLTERFKALWTFHQFVRGVSKTFFSAEAEHSLDFTALYEEVKSIASKINTGSPESVDPLLRALNQRLDEVTRTLRDVDRRISPSFVRRFFEKVRPQDEKIAFYLLRFYFSQPDVDEDVVDKVDFLATVAATGRSDPGAGASRPRSQIKKVFESLTSASVWPRMDNAMTPAIVRAFDELATDVASAREFEELLNQKLLENVRTMKRRVASGLSNPEILTAVAWCNLTSRTVFHRLYDKEERRLDEATGRITNLERELTRGEESTPPEEFKRFRDSRTRFDRQSMERNVRASHVVELKHAIGEVLSKFDISGLAAEDIEEALELVEEVDPDGPDEAFWRPCLDRILAAVELYDDGVGPLKTNISGLAQLNLESWELAAARRAVTHGAPASNQDRTLLRAAALRIKAETESNALGREEEDPVPTVEVVKAARATLARAPQVDHALQELVDDTVERQEGRWWTRSRFRLLRSTADLWLRLDASQSSGGVRRPTN